MNIFNRDESLIKKLDKDRIKEIFAEHLNEMFQESQTPEQKITLLVGIRTFCSKLLLPVRLYAILEFC